MLSKLRIGVTRSGFSLVEVSIALAIGTVLMVVVAQSMQSQAVHLRDETRLAADRLSTDQVLNKVEEELDYAQAATPRGWLESNFDIGNGFNIDIDSNISFPPQGYVRIDAGGINDERISYGLLNVNGLQLLNLTRGDFCGTELDHVVGTPVVWGHQAFHINNQTAPALTEFDGISAETFGNVFYRGDGTGFVFRKPIGADAAGSPQFGATVNNVDLQTGWYEISFERVSILSELTQGIDFNNDGDGADVFDLGRLRRRSWDAANPVVADPGVGICPPIIIQEQCAWGSDLDGDGNQDPMFLWDDDASRLRVRLFVLAGQENGRVAVHRVESVSFLRNGSVD